MRFFSVLLLFLALLQGCGNSAAEPTAGTPSASAESGTTDESQDVLTVRYRSDGFYPGIASEWLEVTYDSETPTILSVVYWSSDDETRQEMEILEQSFSAGEISGYSGQLAFPGQDPIGFGSIEDRFNFVHDGDRFQEFELEEE
ncbi:hypothetical protein QWY85_00785 [Neolewinella lacunae]|uniref:DUF5067 domain-containing protein n=1 Tax=Neolewinella lacunae TaxID=1517758 RepID=A0A923T8U2_9BACT|nr:hypothetical protein [Neolewinella lacunae]MBC6995995.1 hypothetical protein [Neolewinella lacunae]MDN3633169.1 hypothetical protein [Neolewinella lacunae]